MDVYYFYFCGIGCMEMKGNVFVFMNLRRDNLSGEYVGYVYCGYYGVKGKDVEGVSMSYSFLVVNLIVLGWDSGNFF